jgi:hypothetical protein
MVGTKPKIGILTFHRCINYGSYWQARYLVEGLCQRGYNAELLDYVSWKTTLAEWKCALTPVLPTPVPKSDYPRYGFKLLKFWQAFVSLPCSPSFPLHQPEKLQEYGLVIVGSDEVWNLCHPWYGGVPLFYGVGVRTQKLVSYAASFGNYDANAGLDAGLDEYWADQLKSFDQISVRDENSRGIVRSALGIEPTLVLDPCLQFGTADPEKKRNSQPYVAVYGHNFTGWFSRELQQWARRRGYQLVSIGYRNDWVDKQWITASPDEFWEFMAHAEAVATNFFHGCVFALRNAKPFVCELTPYRSHKVQDLMFSLCAQEHLVDEATPSTHYDRMLSEPLAPGIQHQLTMLRQTSDAYLDKVLGDE